MKREKSPIRLFRLHEDGTIFQVRERVARTMSEGLGFNWPAYFRRTTYPDDRDEKRWRRIFAHADWLNPRFIRYALARGITDKRGNLVTDNPSFRQLVRVDRWAQKRGVRVILDPFFLPKAYQYKPWPLAPKAWDICDYYEPGIEDIDRYVSKYVVPLFRHVIGELGCKSVVWFNHVNEPLFSQIGATPPPIDDHVHYVEVLAGIRQGLNEAGFRDIGLMAPDQCTLDYWPIPRMVESGADPDPYIQAYCMHHYHSRFDWDLESQTSPTRPIAETMKTQLEPYARYAHERKKPFLMTELGMFHYGWSRGDPAGVSRHDNFILEAEFILRALAAGADCVLRWSWINPGDMDGWWHLIRTLDGSDEPMPNPYYGYGTLFRFISERAEILEIGSVTRSGRPKTVHALAVKNLDGTRTVFFVNDDYRDCARIILRMNTGGASTVRKIVDDSVRKYHYAGDINATNGEIEHADVLSPMSLTVFTTSERI